MTNKMGIDELLERAAGLPEPARDELVQSMLDIEARYLGVYVTDQEERSALKRSQEDVRNGRLASDDDIKSVFRYFKRA